MVDVAMRRQPSARGHHTPREHGVDPAPTAADRAPRGNVDDPRGCGRSSS